MRVIDNANPEGRTYINAPHPHAALIAAQTRASIRGTAPQCPTCGHWMRLEDLLRETPWSDGDPNGLDWAARVDRSVAKLAKEVERRKAAGLSKYVCVPCRNSRR